MYKLKQKKAFTLVELLVAIAIIGILSVLGYALYSVAKRAARNTARESAMTEISGFIEEYENRFRKRPQDIEFNASNNTIMLKGELASENVSYSLTPLSGITSLTDQTSCTCQTVKKDQLVVIYDLNSGSFGVCLEPSGQKMIEGCSGSGVN